MTAHNAAMRSDRGMQRSLERLSSGLRINRASDDAAGLTVSETLRTQIRGGQQAAKNIQDAINLLNVADGGANEMAAILNRMRTLAVQSANGTLTASDRSGAEDEFTALSAEIANMAGNTKFNGIALYLGAAGSILNSGPQSVSATSPVNNSSVAGTTTQTIASLPVVGGNRVLTLPSAADVYGLGVPGPQSIVVTLINSGSGVTANVPYGAGGFTYNAATHQVLGSGALPPGFDQVRVDYIKQGSLTNIPLSNPPVPGSEVVQANGVTIPAGGYTLAGNLLTITGASRPTASFPTTISAAYTATGTTTLVLATPNPFTGSGATQLNNLTFKVNGAPVSLAAGTDYTLTQAQTTMVGNTPIYTYSVAVNNASIAAAASGQTTITASYDYDYPTIVGSYQLTVQEGANYNDTKLIKLPAVTLGTLGVISDDLSTQAGAQTAIDDLDKAIGNLSLIRAGYGADTNDLYHALNDVNANTEDQAAAESRIRDVDVASETTQLTRQQILTQSSMAMVQAANTQPTGMLQLLSGLSINELGTSG